jgi:hypothetical protein
MTGLGIAVAAAAAVVVVLLVTGPWAGSSGSPTATAQPPTSPSQGGSGTAGPTGSASPTASPTSVSAAAQIKVAQTLFPASPPACGDETGDYSPCPLSSRLESRLTALYSESGVPYRHPMCRCSIAWTSVSYQPGADDTVDVDFNFPGHAAQMVVTMIPSPTGSGWVADDTSCGGSSMDTEEEPLPCYAPG